VSLDLKRLVNRRLRSDGVMIAQCPACAEKGADNSGDHLYIQDEGRGVYGCVVHPGDKGGAHRKRIWELLGKRDASPPTTPVHGVAKKQKGPVRIDGMRKLTASEMAMITGQRAWKYTHGLEFLSDRGLLWHGDVFDYDTPQRKSGRQWQAWVITDSSRRNAQARRLDGGLWMGIGGKKAKSLPGADPSWPIGVPETSDRPLIVMTEGQPDFCAALMLATYEGLNVDNVAPICICGAGNHIHPEALPYLYGKRVRILVHDDDDGRAAGERWAQQLGAAGVGHVDGYSFAGLRKLDGDAVKDLADYATTLGSTPPPPPRIFDDLRAECRGSPASAPCSTANT